MKIGISTSVVQRGRSGIAQHVFAVLRAMLEQRGNDSFVLFALRDDLPLFRFAERDAELVAVDERFRHPVADILWHQMALPRLARRHRLDVIHAPSYRRMLWSAPCARVATIHDLAPFRLAGKYDRARMLYGRVVAPRLARRQHRIVAVSRSTAADLERFFGIDGDSIDVVLNGVDHARFSPGPPDAARARAVAKGIAEPFFLYVARLEHPAKNHVRLIEAFEIFKRRTGSRWQLVFGGADWHGAEEIHARIAASGYRADIRCLGFVADDALPDWYRAAGAFVYPSLFEGFGMPPVEAMACGCPVLCSPMGALAETAGDAAALVDPLDVGAISSALGRLASDEEWRGRLASAGLAHAARFDWKVAGSATLAAYRRARLEYLSRKSCGARAAEDPSYLGSR